MPEYSFLKQKKSNSYISFNDAPSAQVYDIEQKWKRSSKIKTSPSATIGKSERNSLSKEKSPGPGAYNIDQHFANKNGISMKGSHSMKMRTEGPGPARYDTQIIFTSKKYSFTQSKNHTPEKIGPTPTSYTIIEVSDSKQITFPKKQRDSLVQKQKISIPGPGNYDIEAKQSIHQRQFSFTTTKKFNESDRELSIRQLNPGPGEYDITKARKQYKYGKFTKALRNFNNFENVPGPGMYDLLTKSYLKQNGGVIGKEDRSINFETRTPGPGKYDEVSIDLIKSRPQTVLIPRKGRAKTEKSQIPGPGAYHAFKQQQHIIGAALSHEKRLQQKIQKGPGPLSYTPNFDQISEHTINIVIGKQKKNLLTESKTPGPGFYENFASKTHTKGYYFSRKSSEGSMKRFTTIKFDKPLNGIAKINQFKIEKQRMQSQNATAFDHL